MRSDIFRNKSLAGMLLMMVVLTGCSDEPAAPPRLIALAESFTIDAKLSVDKRLPIVVFVSQRGCEFCAALRKHVLFPMIRSDELDGKGIIREVSLDDGFTVMDFSGESIAGADFAGRYAAYVTPTMLFLDSDGAEINEKMVGIGNLEFYGFYLDAALKNSRDMLAAQ